LGKECQVSSLVRHPVAGSATIAGRALGGVFFWIGKSRASSRKALHPRGEIRRGVLRRHGCSWTTGVSWLDDAGSDEVLLRFSRSVGLPKPFPDVLGLAIRIPLDTGGHGDLLLATTGSGRFGRFVLRPARRRGAVYSCLIPYRAATGPVLLAALPLDEDGTQFDFVCASLTGAWSSFGRLEVLPESDHSRDVPVSFDPVLNIVPGLESYTWAAQLRRFAYAGSRRARSAAPV
jgi:hypothetical protein